MPSVIKSVSFGAADALALARFWAGPSGPTWTRTPLPIRLSSRRRAGRPERLVHPGSRAQDSQNRVHFDLRAPGATEDEVNHLERLGARVACRYPHHTVMTDPEGNEFCVEPGPAWLQDSLPAPLRACGDADPGAQIIR